MIPITTLSVPDAAVSATSEEKRMDGINSDKVNINLGGGEGGGMGPAMIAALLNGRNQDSGQAPLLAALLNNRSNGDGNLASLLAANGGGGFGGGAGGVWPLLLLALLGGGGGGLFGGRRGEDDGKVFEAAVLNSLTGLTAAVPTTALETQNAIQNSIAQLALGTQQAFANTKDAVQASAALNLSATNSGTQAVLTAICGLGSKIDQNEIGELRARLARSEHDHHSDRVSQGVSTVVNQTSSQAQAQAQLQRIDDERFGHLHALIASIGNSVQRIKSENDTINFGTMLASANQANTQSAVR